MDDATRTRLLIERLARLSAGAVWEGDLNPSQAAALDYLAKANRFSRSPSHVAEYLASTRGTVSQTLKSLVRKGLLAEAPTAGDRRSIRYRLTEMARERIHRASPLEEAGRRLPAPQRADLADGLAELLHEALRARGMRSFGVCRTCRHHRAGANGAHCTLLKVDLKPEEAGQICHEHAS